MGAHNRLLVSGMEMSFQLATWIAEGMGKTTAEVLEEAVRDCQRRAADPSDETDVVGDAIDADLPRTVPPFTPADIEKEANKLIARRVRQARDAETRRLWRFEEARMRWVQQHKNEPGCLEHVAELEAAIKQAIPDPGDPPSDASDR